MLSFSELRYIFECPYQFKLRFLYGFKPPIREELGFEKSLHDALAEIHKRALSGEVATEDDVPRLVEEHLHLPFANPRMLEQMTLKAGTVLRNCLWENKDSLLNTEYAEKNIELRLDDGLLVIGRIDLIRRLDTDETEIVDFKSDDRAQEENVTRRQLHIYALGYRQLTGQDADLVAVYNLDDGSAGTVRELVDDVMLDSTRIAVAEAGDLLRSNDLCRMKDCAGCDFTGICRAS